MLFVLGLLSTKQVWACVVWCVLCVAMAISAMMTTVSPGEFVSLMSKGCFLFVLWRVLPLPCHYDARDDVYEPRTEVEDFRVVFEGQVVGEARRAQHALIAEVELGSLGKFTFTLVPASRDSRVQGRL